MKPKFIVLTMVVLSALTFTGLAYADTGKENEGILSPKPKAAESFNEDDYNNMTDYMRENGYEDMAKQMESIDKDTMLKIHNDMHSENSFNGGSRSCH